MNTLRAATSAHAAEKPPLPDDLDATRDASVRSSSASVLEPTPGNASERLGRRFGDRPPVLVFSLAVLAGYVLLAAAAIGLGFLLVDVLVPIHAIGHSDESVNEWLAANRSGGLDDASYIGSSIGDIPFIPALVILVAVGAAIMRRWRVFGFIVGAILIEVATYRVSSLIVHRDRPDVPRLDKLPVDQSYPSGHVAASIVVYVGLALLISAHLRSGRLKAMLWTLAVLLPLVVAASRMYRGMHHPLDASAGVLIGLASIAIALVATRAAVEAARIRSGGSRA
jgi:membrane-associated phospholipid phosphatase